MILVAILIKKIRNIANIKYLGNVVESGTPYLEFACFFPFLRCIRLDRQRMYLTTGNVLIQCRVYHFLLLNQ